MPPKPERRTTPLNRAEIVLVARRMLQNSDLDSLSLRRLAGELGVTAPALYAHVEHKGDLLVALAEQGFAELIADFERVEHDDPIERLLAYGRCYVERAIADPETFRLMFVFRPANMPITSVASELPAATAALDLPTAAIEEAIAAGAIHPGRDPVLTAMTLWTVGHGLASVLLLGSSGSRVLLPDNAEELIQDVLTTTLAGLRQPHTR